MAYLVLGLGIVMAALGGLAIASGYPIVQVERGWASVIAGATMLAGGVVTIALGMVLRTLADVRGALLAGAPLPMPARTREAPASAVFEPALAMPVDFAATAPYSLASVPVVAAAVGYGEPPAHEHHPEPSPANRTDAREVAAAPAYHAGALAVSQVPGDTDHANSVLASDPGSDHTALRPAEADHAHPVDHVTDSYAPEPLSTPEHDLPVSAGAPPGDWLDRAFSELDLHMPDYVASRETAAPLTPAAALEPVIMPPAPPEHEPAYADHADAHAHAAQHEAQHAVGEHAFAEHAEDEHAAADHAMSENAEHDPHYPLEAAAHQDYAEPVITGHANHSGVADHADAHQTPDVVAPHHEAAVPVAEPVPEPPVIGRYESDGTSYTMYADGSIAAQSSTSVYRFASMAELKAFIEG